MGTETYEGDEGALWVENMLEISPAKVVRWRATLRVPRREVRYLGGGRQTVDGRGRWSAQADVLWDANSAIQVFLARRADIRLRLSGGDFGTPRVAAITLGDSDLTALSADRPTRLIPDILSGFTEEAS